MRLYIDLCCWNRPFDDIGQARIRAEAAALDVVLERIREGTDQLVWSVYLDVELSAGADLRRVKWIQEQKLLAAEVVLTSPIIEARARSLVNENLTVFDAFHMAAAESCAEVLLTVDDRFLRQARRHGIMIRALNPVDYCDEVKLGYP